MIPMIPKIPEVQMPGTELRRPHDSAGPSAHQRIGPQRGQLRDAAARFETVLDGAGAAPPPASEAWLADVGAAVDGLADAWHLHVAFTEGPDGLFEELLDDSVEVAPEIDRLRRDHEVLDARMDRARELLAVDGAGPDDTKLLMLLQGIAKQVDQHRRRGADLLYRVYSVDLSAGD
jgi:hypothetical protein